MWGTILLLLLISGCARIPEVHWVKPGATMVERNRALAKCQNVAMPLEGCMSMEGYKQQAGWQ